MIRRTCPKIDRWCNIEQDVIVNTPTGHFGMPYLLDRHACKCSNKSNRAEEGDSQCHGEEVHSSAYSNG
jgi:hypothetical protein